jgi:hypothetical protein
MIKPLNLKKAIKKSGSAKSNKSDLRNETKKKVKQTKMINEVEA